METSAKTSYNVMETFVKVSESLMNRISNGNINMENNPPGIKLGQIKPLESENEEKGKRKWTCCWSVLKPLIISNFIISKTKKPQKFFKNIF